MKPSLLYLFLFFVLSFSVIPAFAQVPGDPIIIPKQAADSIINSLKNKAVLISDDTVTLPDATPTSRADSIKSSKKSILASDTSLRKHNPKIATFRSAVIPGWGQAYNKKYWKIPIVYGALGTTAAIFVYNLKTYKSLKKAYIYLRDTIPDNDVLIDKRFQQLSPESIRSYRTSFRQNVDYSVLFFLVFWGLNVVDATVDAHLKSFDVSNDISLKIKPTINNATPGLSFVFTFNDKPIKKRSVVH